MPHRTLAIACAEIATNRLERCSDEALQEVVTKWAELEIGRATYVADSHEFEGQFGDDRMSAYAMEDQMNEIAARERDGAVRALLARFLDASIDQPAPGRLATALSSMATQRFGHYAEKTLAGSLGKLERALTSLAASVGNGAPIAS